MKDGGFQTVMMIKPSHAPSFLAHRISAALLAGVFLAIPAGAQSAEPATATPALPTMPEESAIAKLTAPGPHWAFIRGGGGGGGTRIWNGDTGKMLGTLPTSGNSELLVDPAGKYYYVSETLWSKGNRGTRFDIVSVYDSVDIKLQSEIPYPGRMIIGGQKRNFVLSADGKQAYIYNFDPASSVNVVDLEKRKFVRNVELPGCGVLIPNPTSGFSALCADGTITSVDLKGSKPVFSQTEPFFQAADDPIFANFSYDKSRSAFTMLSYTGLVYEATQKPTLKVAAPWSLQEAAGVRKATNEPLNVNWLPGGAHMMAHHPGTNQLYVLMHMGEFWTHSQGGTELWVADLNTKKVVKRIALKSPTYNVAVTQDDKPLIFLTNRENQILILDGTTYEKKHDIKDGGGGAIAVLDR